VIGSSLIISPTEVDGVEEDDEVDKDDECDEDDECGPIGRARMCCRLKPIGKQRQATQGAGRLPGLLVAPVPRSMARDPAHVLASGSLGVPPDLVPDQEGIIC
jgi:hypothetical protein